MVRTRLATLTLAGGLLLTSSGCFGLLDNFRAWRQGSAQDCTCYDVTTGHDGVPATAEGPVLVAPQPTFTPPTAFVPPQPTPTPMGPPPRIVPIPAQPMPWAGQQ
ncbi:MAG: hypothetical protein L0Y71_24995 [Gemmataceae bacterium]|nr:hypothetical protein [Gemmataceae bacterium]